MEWINEMNDEISVIGSMKWGTHNTFIIIVFYVHQTVSNTSGNGMRNQLFKQSTICRVLELRHESCHISFLGT